MEHLSDSESKPLSDFPKKWSNDVKESSCVVIVGVVIDFPIRSLIHEARSSSFAQDRRRSMR